MLLPSTQCCLHIIPVTSTGFLYNPAGNQSSISSSRTDCRCLRAGPKSSSPLMSTEVSAPGGICCTCTARIPVELRRQHRISWNCPRLRKLSWSLCFSCGLCDFKAIHSACPSQAGLDQAISGIPSNPKVFYTYL